ncbi:MAG: hypothetical protein ABWX92_03640 [Mycetocola sp.]
MNSTNSTNLGDLRSNPLGIVAVAISLMLCLSGCTLDVHLPPTPSSSDGDAGSTTEPSVKPETVPDEREPVDSEPEAVVVAPADLDRRSFAVVQTELDDAVRVVDGFWQTHWSEFYTGVYEAPTVVGTYDYSDPTDTTSCLGELAPPDNAIYCADHSVMWEKALMEEAYAAGDAFVYLIVAHEWGHAIQARIAASEVWNASELQADCFAGAVLFGAAADGTLLFEEGDAAEITNGLTTLADLTAWTDTSDHGDPFDRIDAFNDGRTLGVAGCYPHG